MLASIKRLVSRAAASRGIELRKVPRTLLQNWQARLGVDLRMVVALQESKHPEITFVQIGAYDGVSGDALHELIGPNWRGIFVEPQPSAFVKLKQRYGEDYRFTLANVAIGDRDEVRNLYAIDTRDGNLPPWAEQVASFRRDVLESQVAHIPDIKQRILTIPVECVTLATLLKRSNIEKLDLLQLDTEGYDGVIVRSIDFQTHRPAIIRYEHKHLDHAERDQTISKLISAGYKVAVEYEDTIAFCAG